MSDKTPKLGGRDRFQPAEFSIRHFAAKVDPGITLEDILHPEYFGNHLDKMKPGMEITVLSDDFKLDVRLRVLSVTPTTASLRVLDDYSRSEETNAKVEDAKPKKGKAAAKVEDANANTPAGNQGADQQSGKLSIDDLKVAFAGPNHKWRITQGEKVIEHGFGTEADAKARAEAYVQEANA